MPDNAQHRPSFKTDLLDYELPEALIAQTPPPKREDARLLVLDRATGQLTDSIIADLPSFLKPHDLLVLNDTKVLPAKFVAQRQTGGMIPGLFLDELLPGKWVVLLQGSRKLRVSETLALEIQQPFESDLTPYMRLLESRGKGHWLVDVSPRHSAETVLAHIGRPPLPPYIRREHNDQRDAVDMSRYQTVYSQHPGAIAAPTAGLHLTYELLDRCKKNDINTTCVTLHVGLGTFKPVNTDDLSQHQMHTENYEITAKAVDALMRCQQAGGRIGAVGTTSVRVLETAASLSHATHKFQVGSGHTQAFFYPPYEFQAVDFLLTNFHLPRSTLLALVMALAGVDLTRKAYRHAVANEYRFFSYGDAMLIL